MILAQFEMIRQGDPRAALPIPFDSGDRLGLLTVGQPK